MKPFVLCCILSASAFAQTYSGVSLGYLGSMNGYVPSGSPWHVDISGYAVDAQSATIISDFGSTHLHADFGTEYGVYGIPYRVVNSTTTPLVPYTVNASTGYPNDSDIAYAPLPADLQIEGSPPQCGPSNGDNHAVAFDQATGALYEFYHMLYCPTSTPQWSADAATIWDTTLSNEQRPYGPTSVDAAGLSVFSGLIRYDEVQTVLASSACVANANNCYLPHAIRMTADKILCDYSTGSRQSLFELPATHGACGAGSNAGGTDPNGPVEGQRYRLKASFDISSYSATNQVILRTAKKYGWILADLGGAFYFQGTPDTRWNTDDIALLGNVPSSAIDVVQQSTAYNTGVYPTGASPTVSLTALATTITAGQSTVLTPAASMDTSYAFIDKLGLVRVGTPITVSPSVTTTYTLTGRSYYGTGTSPVTVFVNPAGSGSGTPPAACMVSR